MSAKLTRRQFLIGSSAAAVAAVGGTAAFLNTPQFGRKPNARRLERLRASPNWHDGAFRNYEPYITPPPQIKRGNRLKLWWDFLLADKSSLAPPTALRIVKTDIAALDPEQDLAVWLGHSSIYLQLAGLRILVDPVFCTYASPLPFINRAFLYTENFSADDFPEIDVLAITHDHWDHLDYPTIAALLPKVRTALCPLGVGEYLEQWGMAHDAIREGDWFDSFDLGHGVTATITPTRHFSGRFTRRNQTLWCGFAFSPHFSPKVFVAGDGGFGNHFHAIAQALGRFDFAFLENGQYNVRWPSVHSHPRETASEADIVGAKFVIPVHNCKFTLSNHKWDAPMRELARHADGKSWSLLTPRIGAVIDISSPSPTSRWFEQANLPNA